jgi:hypothetical protein
VTGGVLELELLRHQLAEARRTVAVLEEELATALQQLSALRRRVDGAELCRERARREHAERLVASSICGACYERGPCRCSGADTCVCECHD